MFFTSVIFWEIIFETWIQQKMEYLTYKHIFYIFHASCLYYIEIFLVEIFLKILTKLRTENILEFLEDLDEWSMYIPVDVDNPLSLFHSPIFDCKSSKWIHTYDCCRSQVVLWIYKFNYNLLLYALTTIYGCHHPLKIWHVFNFFLSFILIIVVPCKILVLNFASPWSFLWFFIVVGMLSELRNNDLFGTVSDPSNMTLALASMVKPLF